MALPRSVDLPSPPLDPTRAFAARAAGIPGSPIDRSIALMRSERADIISFAIGAPAPSAIPAADLNRFAAALLTDDSALNYGPTEGETDLRGAILEQHALLDGPRSGDEFLVTAGGTQGIDLVAKLFVERGDLVVAESPTYANGVAIVTSYEGEVARCPVDGDGMIVEAIPGLVRQAGRRPKLIYVIPNFQNPGGATLSLARRHRLLALAETYDALILEDDPYGLLHYDAPPPPSLYALDGGRGRVIAVRSFSKILAPGLRAGWVMAPAAVVRAFVAARQGMDTCTNVLGQRMIAAYLRGGALAPHLARLRAAYRERRDIMLAALDQQFGGVLDVRWTRPGGGAFLWLTLAPAVSGDALAAAALAEGVACVPGSAFVGPGEPDNALRLCFTHPDADAIIEGVRRLRRAYDGVGSKLRSPGP
jgi:2-aminoadipate transaminase